MRIDSTSVKTNGVNGKVVRGRQGPLEGEAILKYQASTVTCRASKKEIREHETSGGYSVPASIRGSEVVICGGQTHENSREQEDAKVCNDRAFRKTCRTRTPQERRGSKAEEARTGKESLREGKVSLRGRVYQGQKPWTPNIIRTGGKEILRKSLVG